MPDPRDPLGARYRELAREEPPAHLDAAILAASRRAVGARPGAQRWFVPVSLAAVLVLGIGVALRMQVEQPGIETSAPQSEYTMPSAAPAEPAPQAATEPAEAAALREAAPVPAPAPRRLAKERTAPAQDAATPRPEPVAPKAAEAGPADTAARGIPAPAAPPPAAAPTFAPDPALKAESSRAAQAITAPPPPPAPAPPAALRAPAPAQGAASRMAPQERHDETVQKAIAPEEELERIARLREAGRNDEADRALAQFHRRFPGHRIPDATWERVRPR